MIDYNANGYFGLFGATASNAVLQNVGLLNVTVNGGSNGGTGALAGVIRNNTAIRYSYVDGGSVSTRTNLVGGLVGFVADAGASISHSYANVSVSAGVGGGAGYAAAGGLVGGNNGGISYSYATGSVSAPTGNVSSKYIGGLTGMQNAGTTSNSYATGAISGNNTLGGLIGSLGGGSVSSSYWDKTTTGQNSSAGGAGLFTDQWPTLGPLATGTWSTADWGAGNPYPGIKALPYITITANASQTYGSATTVGIASILDQNGTDASGLVNTSGLSWSASTTAAAGTTSAVRGSGASATGYQILYAGNVTVGKAPLTVTANGLSKTYDGLAYNGGNGVSYSGFVNGEGFGVLGGTLAYGGNSQGALNTGNYAITPSGLTSSNYAISFANGNLAITPATLTVTALDATKTYDGQAFRSGNGVGYSGFVNGETPAVLGGALTYGGSSQGAVNAGNYAITPSGLTASNYAISFANGNLAITPTTLTVTALDATKTYDGQAFRGNNGVGYSGLVNGETAAVLGGALAYGGPSQGAVNAGNYAITPSGLTASNYAISFASGNLAINPATLTVTALNASKTYDGQAFRGGNGVGYSGFVNGETPAVLGGALTYGGSNQDAVNAGNYVLTPSGLTANNYAIAFVDGTLTINPAPITGSLIGTVNKIYDGTNEALLKPEAFLLKGFIGNDGATITKTVGTYASANAGSSIPVKVNLPQADYAPLGNTLLRNYILPSTLTGAVGVINKAPLNITANNADKIYDGQAFRGGNGVSYSGFVNGEKADALGGKLVYGGNSQGAINGGSYALTPSGLTAANYAITFTDGRLTVNAVDSYNPANNQLTIPTITVAGKIYNDVVVSVAEVLGYTTGGSPASSNNSYDPVTNILTIPSVVVGGVTYTNVRVAV
ncbi:beta strand repeat-containing protein, partial [Candidatus Methylobacter oryzae]|uniref:beta strand repeat-containing protein n=1 Tax=Candidatus Methylobacter oryzae TaxID=2497749 RepID=UPI001F502EA2